MGGEQQPIPPLRTLVTHEIKTILQLIIRQMETVNTLSHQAHNISLDLLSIVENTRALHDRVEHVLQSLLSGSVEPYSPGANKQHSTTQG